jgi:hypothetical protein
VEDILRVLHGARSISASALRWLSTGMPAGRVRCTIRIRHREITQDRTLGRLHAARLGLVSVIIAEKMQKAVHNQMGEVVIERFALAVSLAPDGFVGEHDVAQMIANEVTAEQFIPPVTAISGRKRQYIGRRIDPAPMAVEPAHRSIVGQNDGELGSFC